MNVILKVGDYGSEKFSLSMKDAMTIAEILMNASVDYKSKGLYKRAEPKITIICEPHNVEGPLTPIDMPEQKDDEINEI